MATFLMKAPADLTQISHRRAGIFPRMEFESILLSTDRPGDDVMPSQMMLWGPVFRTIDADAEAVRARVASLLTFLESIQEP